MALHASHHLHALLFTLELLQTSLDGRGGGTLLITIITLLRKRRNTY